MTTDTGPRTPGKTDHRQALSTFGRWAGWGLLFLGLVAGLLVVAEALADRELTIAEWARALGWAGCLAAACGLAGWGTSVLAQTTAAAINDYVEIRSRGEEHLAAHSAQAIELLRKIAGALELSAESRADLDSRDIRQAPSFELASAIRNRQWTDAERLVGQFESDFPDDPRCAAFRKELRDARQVEIQDRLAQLEAAQDVNDPERVLELYQGLSESLEADSRAPLAAKLAPWFLGLIHRRLRVGKIQPDVVQLAGRFAETFAATHEGASVRASLPTLRRSVGLCPRCAQPYTGIGEACPRCAGGGASTVATAVASPESAET
jgi:hypothetical protein